ncbi:MAG: protein translocase subunit SecF [Polyangiaceae bacterium]|nr:protein translocase subunit SecF [Polyangiaceae bacterium]MCB9608074.1 protein translocase subunit SecF [Polyangiaceae bacterium]
MQLFPVGKVYDFMRMRRIFGPMSFLLVLLAFGSIFYPGPKLGTDFKGGTEVEVAFNQPVQVPQLRDIIKSGGFSSPDIVRVEEGSAKNRFMIRVQEVSSIDEAKQREVETAVCFGEGLPEDRCPKDRTASEVKFSPGGDKVSVRYREAPDLARIRQQMSSVSGVAVRDGENAVTIQNSREHRVEIQLKSKGDQLMDVLRTKLGADVVPAEPLRVEWIGPKAGAQLRDAALKSILIALVFITAYIAFRFDLRFAPGAVIALIHDAVLSVGVLVLVQKELSLSTVAAVLTIVSYSVNDTVIVYDRVRENLGRMRGASFMKIINVSLSEMLSRTVLTSCTTIFSLMFFFVRGTGTLKDFSFTLIVGLILGTYSSIYVALPLTEYLDRKLFSKVVKKKPSKPIRKQGEAVI